MRRFYVVQKNKTTSDILCSLPAHRIGDLPWSRVKQVVNTVPGVFQSIEKVVPEVFNPVPDVRGCVEQLVKSVQRAERLAQVEVRNVLIL